MKALSRNRTRMPIVWLPLAVDGHTLCVKVNNGETTQFYGNGKPFTFAFEARPTIGPLNPSAFVPDSGMALRVRVYTGANPLDQGSRP